MNDSNDKRSYICVGDDEKKIARIKKKYKNMEMSNETAGKIKKLEVANKILSAAMVASGIVTAIDLIVPDPVFGLDEAALTALTTGLATAKSTVKSHIDNLALEGSTEIQAEEVNKLTKAFTEVAKSVKSKKDK